MINKFPTIVSIYNRYKKASDTIKASIEIRITYNYKQKYISTGIYIYPKQWKNNTIVNCPDALQLNQYLNKLIVDIRQIIIDMSKEGSINIALLPSRLDRSNNNKGFIDFCCQRAVIRKYGKTKDSQERYNRFIRLFTSWGKIKEFSDINEMNIISYDKYLLSQGMKNYSKWNNYHRFLNSFIIDAIQEGYLSKNPYNWVNIDKGKNVKGIDKYLSPLEFDKLKKTPLPTNKLEKIRDLFVFQTYTCLSYSDLKNFNPDNIKIIKEIKVYISTREKTSKEFIIPLTSTAINILEKYNYKLPIISNVKYNEYLKIIAQAAGIEKPISTHWARHTGATLLLNKGINLGIISKICGHSSIKITEQVYAKLLDETIVNAIKSINE